MEPKLYKGKKPLEVTAEMVFAAVKSILQAGAEEDFIRRCREMNATVTVPPELVNMVKTYLFERGAHETMPMAARVVDSDRCTPPRR